MSPLIAALLGLIQALTEFLPVSSSGHLVLASRLLNARLENGVAFEIAVHFGTLLSVTWLLRREVWGLMKDLGGLLRKRRPSPTLLYLALASLPAGLLGVLFKDALEARFGDARGVGVALIVTGLLLLSTLLRRGGDRPIGALDALLIGFAQAFAILPGVSRSGSTIAVALHRGIEAEAAARFSFLMSLPVVAGATLLKARDLLAAPPPAEAWLNLGVGAAVSFIAGIGALWLLLGVVRRGWFAHFGWYCLPLGVLTLILI
ncbi:undecaprenyl-diphosphate phosphatase [Myxococcota bacterium]|nr:undecaprenyl-diphosphate phosphatase [Myxococcota bacterium]MBU1432949.1 undecaprenyl-diphosphate phosphatase [Myxococcota bacterium]MBU1896303.1 undecaprenyl-diphosphate phosphatase [Myxococcota bacterium]